MEEEKRESHEPSEHAEHHHKKSMTEKIRENPWVLSTFILGILAVILIGAVFSGFLTGHVISKERAANNLVAYLDKNIDSSITLVNVTEEAGLYLATVSYKGESVPVYVTKDGSSYTTVLNTMATANPSSSSPSSTPTTVPKTEKPSIELYVMGFCPYGNEAEKTMQSVYNLLKDKVDWKIHFIVSVSGSTVNSLHGPNEVTEDEREACVIKNYGVGTWFTFANYVNNNCGSNGSCWQDAAKVANVDVNTINSCVTSNGLDLMKAEETASNAAGATGSPTFIINGVQSNSIYQYGNSETYKGAICSAFNNVPSECSQKLTSASSTASGSCG